MVLWSKELADYLHGVIADFQADNDTTRALRRLHMKEVHMHRRRNHEGVRMVRRIRRMV